MIKFRVHDHWIHVSEDTRTASVLRSVPDGKPIELESFTTLGTDLAQTQAIRAARKLKYGSKPTVAKSEPKPEKKTKPNGKKPNGKK